MLDHFLKLRGRFRYSDFFENNLLRRVYFLVESRDWLDVLIPTVFLPQFFNSLSDRAEGSFAGVGKGVVIPVRLISGPRNNAFVFYRARP